MDRPIMYSAEQARSFDVDSLSKNVMLGLAWEAQDLLGQSITVAAGITPTATGTLAVSLSAGRIYQLASADASAFAGAVLPQDTTQILQQGWSPAQSLTLSTTGLAAGQSRWVLIEAGFSQADAIAPNDPNNGLLPYFNAANPLLPLQGAGGNGQTQPTVRQGLAVIKIVYGNIATTGSETPPNADTGYVGLYLIDLAYGQTAVTQGQILTAGPSVGTGVPSNYPYAPILAGLLNSHHGGTPGQAPQINLASEVTGTLASVHLSQVRIQLLANATVYVNPQTGNDANAGTSASPWQTFTKALQYCNSIDTNGFDVTISCSGSFSTGLNISAPISGGGSLIVSFSPGSVISDTAANAITISGGAVATISGPVTLTSSGSASIGNGNGILAIGGGQVFVENGPIFGSCALAHMRSADRSLLTINNNYTISAGATYHLSSNDLSSLLLQNGSTGSMIITVENTPAFTDFASSTQSGIIVANSGKITISGSATGARYNVDGTSRIDTYGAGANFFPGSAAGTATNIWNYT